MKRANLPSDDRHKSERARRRSRTALASYTPRTRTAYSSRQPFLLQQTSQDSTGHVRGEREKRADEHTWNTRKHQVTHTVQSSVHRQITMPPLFYSYNTKHFILELPQPQKLD